MAFRLGLVGLCTSHPESWVPIIRELAAEKLVDMEVVAAGIRARRVPPDLRKGSANSFQSHMRWNVLRRCFLLSMASLSIRRTGTGTWNRRNLLSKQGKSVFIDKPVAGNQKDANLFLDWMKQGYRVTGGSVMRYCKEVAQFLAIPETERGRIYTAYSSIGVVIIITAFTAMPCLPESWAGAFSRFSMSVPATRNRSSLSGVTAESGC